MSGYGPSGPPGSGPDGPWVGKHRAPVTSARKIYYRVVVPLIAVGAVIALIVILVSLNGHSSGNGPGPGVIASSPRVVIPSTSPSVSATPTVKTSTSPTTSATPLATHTRAPHHHHRPAYLTAMASVRVYNSTAIQGLAHHVAAEIEARGWKVTDIGNVSGASSETTLYYSPGSHAAARHLASEFSGIRRIEPNQVAGVSYSGVTLVLTADWHD